MDLTSYLKNYQHLVYDTFINALNRDSVAQTYLIKGINGAPILDVAKFLAKTLICEERNPLACTSCLSCLRFDEGNYSDLLIIDGEKQTIKVPDIEELQKFLSNSSLEKKGKKIYIINCLENANKESVNALLKTLEEPSKNVYAFITTKNEVKLLPTILSRCQILNLLPMDRLMIEKEAIKEGIDPLDAEILSYLYANLDTIKTFKEEEIYQKCKDALIDTIDSLQNSINDAIYYCQNKLIKIVKSKEEARLYIDLLALIFKDLLNLKIGREIVISSQKENYQNIVNKINNIDKCYLEIMTSRSKIEDNATISLLLEHLFIYIKRNGETKNGRK